MLAIVVSRNMRKIFAAVGAPLGGPSWEEFDTRSPRQISQGTDWLCRKDANLSFAHYTLFCALNIREIRESVLKLRYELLEIRKRQDAILKSCCTVFHDRL